VSERGERQSSRRVPVRRRCEILAGEAIIPAIIENVSANGAGIRIANLNGSVARLERIEIRVPPFAPIDADPILPCMVRHTTQGDGSTLLGVRYLASTATHYRLVADLLYANSDQWSAMQAARRVNPGLLRGTIWFYGLAIRETARGLFYFGRATKRPLAPELQGQREAEDAR
jgi:cellulose synthase (UDP-forming)